VFWADFASFKCGLELGAVALRMAPIFGIGHEHTLYG